MINKPAVEALYNHYHAKVKTNPDLYTNSRDKNSAVLVVLPKELLAYANKGSGHSGFAASARPVGIRRVVTDAKKYLAEIFSSPEALARFIESSECDAEEYIAAVRARHMATLTPRIPAAKDEFWNRYGKEDLTSICSRYGRATVQNAWNTLNIDEFEQMFGLVEVPELA